MNPISASDSLAQPVLPARDAWATRLQDLEASQPSRPPLDATDAVIAMLTEFETSTRDERERTLHNSNAPDNDDLQTCDWIATQYERLARTARAITERTAGTPAAATCASAWAYAILLRGHAMKWRQAAGQRAIAPRGVLHQIFKSAAAAGIGDQILAMVFEGHPVNTTIEALYVRTLLLERFASGSLSARRLEILDTWLLSWMGSMWLSRDASSIRDGPVLCIDTTSETHGLMRRQRGETADYFVALLPLERQLSRAIQTFHRGVMFPGWGMGMAFRIDDHVGVITCLEHEFHILAHGAETKSARAPIGREVDVSAVIGIDAVLNACEATPNRSAGTHGETYRLLDVSETGLGLLSSAERAATVNVNDLLAVRLTPREPALLGLIVRKATAADRNKVVLGVRILSKRPWVTSVSRISTRGDEIKFSAIFVSGTSPQGDGDAMVVSDDFYRFNLTHTVDGGLGAEIFLVRPGRVRINGRGWKMVSFDVLPTR